MDADKIAQMAPRKRDFYENAQKNAAQRDSWIDKNSAYYEDDLRYMRFLVPPGARVLDLGCGTGRLLAGLNPSFGVGVDISENMLDVAKKKFPDLDFRLGDVEDPDFIDTIEGTFDYVILADTIGMLEDIESTLKSLQRFFHKETRLVISYYSSLWTPLLNLGTRVGRRMPQPQPNLLSETDFSNLLSLTDFAPVKTEWRQLIPFNLAGIGRFINRYLAPLPILRSLCLRNYVVARSEQLMKQEDLSTTILIPCRNERGNIERAIKELPRFGSYQEVIYVEGNSSDGTFEECLRVQEAYKGEWDIKVLKQDGKGKGDAVRKGFANASCDILMILDADLTVPPADLPKFHEALASGKGEFVNGTRLVYPKEDEAMRFLNTIANRAFAMIFSYLLNQRFTDTLCGTKVLLKKDYDQIVENRHYFGDFDPFGDFDLLFGAAKANMQIIEVPVRYKARTYGETQISRFRDGLLLLRMVVFAFAKLKAI